MTGIRAGVHWHGQWEGPDITNARRDQCLDLIANAHLDLRMDIEWRYIETAKGQYSAHELAKYDYVFNGAKQRGISVLGIPIRTPDWANPNTGVDGAAPPLNPQDYGDFCAWAAQRWQLDAYEIWNEQNSGFFNGTPMQYVGLLRAAYPKIHAAQPSAKVLTGGLVANDDSYVQAMYTAGAKNYFDVLALHPYQQPSNKPPATPDTPPAVWNYQHYPAVRNIMLNWNDGDKPVWFTEFGYSTHANTGGEPNWDLGVTEMQQRDFLLQAFDIAKAWPNVQRIYAYKLDDDTGRGLPVQLENYGIVHHDLSPKPAYQALKERTPMTPTDRQLAAQADAAFRATTITYPQWQKNVKAGKYPALGPPSQFGIGFEALSKIDPGPVTGADKTFITT